MEALKESNADFSNNVDFDWIPEVSDFNSEPNIDPVAINDMLFDDGINTEDETE